MDCLQCERILGHSNWVNNNNLPLSQDYLRKGILQCGYNVLFLIDSVRVILWQYVNILEKGTHTSLNTVAIT